MSLAYPEVMTIELVPDPGPEDPVAQAALAALSREDLATGLQPAGLTSAWRRAGLDEAMNRDLSRARPVR